MTTILQWMGAMEIPSNLSSPEGQLQTVVSLLWMVMKEPADGQKETRPALYTNTEEKWFCQCNQHYETLDLCLADPRRLLINDADQWKSNYFTQTVITDLMTVSICWSVADLLFDELLSISQSTGFNTPRHARTRLRNTIAQTSSTACLIAGEHAQPEGITFHVRSVLS